MKFVVLIWVVFQMLSFTASDTNSTTTESYTLVNSTNLAKPGCNSRCGDLIVPYPFGVGDSSECYINEGFRIYCNTSLNPPKATIKKGGYTSIKLISDSTLRLSNKLSSKCYDANGRIYNDFSITVNLTGKPYSFSEVNKFIVIGCYDSSWLETSTEKFVGDECGGNGCCQSPIPNDLISYSTSIYSLLDSPDNRSFDTCTYSFVGDENVFKFKGRNDLNDTNFKKRIEDTVPLVLEWAIGKQRCSEAKATGGYACQLNSICVDSTRESGGYHCKCKEGYEGNPYLLPGCQALVVGLLATLSGVAGIFFGVRKRKLIKLREKFFEQNGGVFLKQKLNAPGTSEAVIMFSSEQLRKATDNYSEERIIGRGGSGVVYKGILPINVLLQ